MIPIDGAKVKSFPKHPRRQEVSHRIAWAAVKRSYIKQGGVGVARGGARAGTVKGCKENMKIRPGAWVVVCDGQKALILENRGDEVFPDLRMRYAMEHDAPPTHELGTDAPGRVQPSVGTARSAVEQTDWHDAEERNFLKRVDTLLHRAVLAGDPKSVILVAPPRALGILRELASPQLRNAVEAEAEKDYVRKPVDEIERLLSA